MAARAKRLPVGSIPEEPAIALMRDDMVNNRRWFTARFAAGMLPKVDTARMLPLAVIAACACGRPATIETRLTLAIGVSVAAATGASHDDATTTAYARGKHRH